MKLREELGKPVLTSNQCGLWGALRGLGLPDTIDALGTLFQISHLPALP